MKDSLNALPSCSVSSIIWSMKRAYEHVLCVMRSNKMCLCMVHIKMAVVQIWLIQRESKAEEKKNSRVL